MEKIAGLDGKEFGALVRRPDRRPAPGILVLQEIFGLNSYIGDVCSRLAAEGFVALAPDVFWRTEPGVVMDEVDEVSVRRAMALARSLDIDRAVDDLLVAVDYLRSLPETSDRVGVLGFCLGGTLAYLLATRTEVDVCVSYYGAGVPKAIHRLERLHCRTVFHFGELDPVIPSERLQPLVAAASDYANVEVHIAPGAGHAFDNPRSGADDDRTAAARAWETTLSALRDCLEP